MAVTYPVIFTPIDDLEVGKNAPSTEEVGRKIAQNMNFLKKLMPIGEICAIHVNQPSVPALDRTIFQLCDGALIEDETSPLRSTPGNDRYTPNTEDRYIRGANNSTVIGNELGGAATVNLAHAHGGATGIYTRDPGGPEGAEGSNYLSTPYQHSHTIASDLSAAEPLDPPYMKMGFYIRLN